MKPRIIILLLLILPVSLLISILPCYGDVVIRKDGRRIEGKILEDNMDWVIIRTKYGEATIDKELIEKVIRGDVKETGKNMEGAGFHWDHKEKRSVFGHQFVTAAIWARNL